MTNVQLYIHVCTMRMDCNTKLLFDDCSLELLREMLLIFGKLISGIGIKNNLPIAASK